MKEIFFCSLLSLIKIIIEAVKKNMVPGSCYVRLAIHDGVLVIIVEFRRVWIHLTQWRQ